MRATDGSMTWTEITVANPFPGTAALAMSFRRGNGTLDPRFFAAQTVGGFAQAFFLVRDITTPPPNSTSGWFVLTSTPTPVVPAANIYWWRGSSAVNVIHVPIQQLAADGFPLGDAAAAPPPPPPPPGTPLPPPPPLAQISRPPSAEAWADAMFGAERSQAVLDLFRRAESAAGEGAALEPTTFAEGVLVDDEADEFRRRFQAPPDG
jgi:hypothetical protein